MLTEEEKEFLKSIARERINELKEVGFFDNI